MKPIWTILWKSISFFVLWGILYTPFVAWLAPIIARTTRSNPFNLRLYFDGTGALTILIAAWIMVRFVDRRSFSTLGFSLDQLLRDLTLGLVIGFIWLALSLLILWLFGWITPDFSGQIESAALGIAALAMILNTVIQEVLARGYIFQTIQGQINATWAIFLTAIVFVLYHAAGLQGNWLPTLNVFCAGVLFGIAYYRSGNLWLPIAIHFAWNFLLGSVLGLAVSGQDLNNSWHFISMQGPALFTGGAFGLEGSLVVTVVTILGVVAIWQWYPRHSTSIALDQTHFEEKRKQFKT